VLGAGLAGTSVSKRLIARGWTVHLIDAGSGPGQAASGNPAGVVRPLVSRDDNRTSQFTRHALLYAAQRWSPSDGPRNPFWHPTGVLQIARDEAQFAQWRAMLDTLPHPGEWVQFLSRQEASIRSGFKVPQGGLLFPLAGWAEPVALCHQPLTEHKERLYTHWNQTVHALVRSQNQNQSQDPDWIALDSTGAEIARGSIVILASGAGIPFQSSSMQDTLHRQSREDLAPGRSARHDFLPLHFRPLQRLRGETLQLKPEADRSLDLVICGEGYVCPSPDQSWSVGATYDAHPGFDLTPEGIQENTDKLHTLLGESSLNPTFWGGRVGYRSVTIDRLPIVGSDPEWPGLWHCRAFASRGLAWNELASEVLIAQIQGEPLPLSQILAESISPSRPNLRNRHP